MKKLLKFYLLTFVLLSDFVAFAQPGDDDGGGGGGLEGGDPEPAPINSKLILLAIIGILFVMYTFRKNRKEA
ncbi:MAG TPA: hypothetical protein PKN96_02375 [Flavobacterium sp.]|uniref:hypothetical protein n=1 Tax=Flavobacterium sp. TaxID=239 RepID=UPI002C800E35|nr:hypothetical protein [Flavobacterium sp.]HNP32120.1 hypothetical protein [Flavobacterium sp.]